MNAHSNKPIVLEAIAKIKEDMKIFPTAMWSSPDGRDLYTEHDEVFATAVSPEIGRYLVLASPKRLSALFVDVEAGATSHTNYELLEGAARAIKDHSWAIGNDKRTLVVNNKEVIACRMFHHPRFFAAIQPAVILEIIEAYRRY